MTLRDYVKAVTRLESVAQAYATTDSTLFAIPTLLTLVVLRFFVRDGFTTIIALRQCRRAKRFTKLGTKVRNN